MDEVLALLAIGTHPDDAEIGAGGTLAGMSARGLRVAVMDLTRGELASNGTPAEREREAERAGRELGLAVRWNAGLPEWPREDGPALDAVVAALRRYRPAVLLAPYAEDPHPGHAWAGRVATEAACLSGLARWGEGAPFQPAMILHYFINGETVPSLLVDVSQYYGRKRAALAAHVSQFAAGPGSTPTRLNSGVFLHLVESRDRHFGARMGAQFGEGFWSPRPVPVRDPASLVLGGGERS